MAQIEHLYATKIRLAVETALSSGVAGSRWTIPPLTAAAVQRVFHQTAERMDVFRQLTRREIVCEAWEFKTSHEVGLLFLRWILIPHFTYRGSLHTLEPENEGPSFVMEVTSDAGDISRYSGCRVTEFQILWEDRRIVRLDITWSALKRDVLESPLAGNAGDEFDFELVPNNTCGVAITNGVWATFPREDNAAIMHGGQLFLTRPIVPTNYGPDGQPGEHDRQPWSCIAEIYMPETPGVTDQAFADQWHGGVVVWMGPGVDSFRINNAIGFISDEDLKAYDWRVRRLAIQAFSDARRALVEYRSLEPAIIDTDEFWLTDTDGAILVESEFSGLFEDSDDEFLTDTDHIVITDP